MDDDPEIPFLPVAEERLTVATRREVTGRVRVLVETLTQDVPVRAELHGERVEVTRVPIGREVTERPDIRTEGPVTILPVVEEILIVERRLMLREEIHLRRVAEVETVETTVPLRRQTVRVERDDIPPTQPQKERDDD